MLNKSDQNFAVDTVVHIHKSLKHRFGQVAIIGRPNVGKSSLINALIGEKMSITSRKAQTTRHAIRGILTTDTGQLVFVDTPGFQVKYTHSLNQILNQTVKTTLADDLDLILFVIEAGHFKAEDKAILSLIKKGQRVILLANKTDRLKSKDQLLPLLDHLQTHYPFLAMIPLCVHNRQEIAYLRQFLMKQLPVGPPHYPKDSISDRNQRFFIAEILREKIFRFMGDELPYTTIAVIDEFQQKNKRCKIAATIFVKSAAHKGMMIGAKGERLKQIGQQARIDMEKFLQMPVYLALWVKVKKSGADSHALMNAYGYSE